MDGHFASVREPFVTRLRLYRRNDLVVRNRGEGGRRDADVTGRRTVSSVVKMPGLE
jgi:hypothetical protein